MKRAVCLLLVLTLLAAVLSGCSRLENLFKFDEKAQAEPTESVEDMLSRCQSACNSADIGGILDCINPSLADPIRATMKVAQTLSDKSDEEMLNTVIGLVSGDDVTDAKQVCQTLSAQVESIDRDGDNATAHLKFSYEINGQKYIGTTDAKCEAIGGQWYLTKLTAG